MRRWIALALIFGCVPARAEDPKNEARKHFGQGSIFYTEGRYAEAIGEFERARALVPEPVLEYDIAKALDRLGRWEAAVSSYKRYLQVTSGKNESEVIARIAELEERLRVPVPVPPPIPAPPPAVPAPSPVVQLVALPPSPPPKPLKRPLRTAAWAVGGVSLVFAGVGAGLLGSVAARYNDLAGSCAPTCSGGSWSALPAQEHAGEALLGVAAALAVTDIVLWVVQRRHR